MRADVVGVTIIDRDGIEHEYYNHERAMHISVTHTEVPGVGLQKARPCSYITVVIPIDKDHDSYPEG